MEISHAPDVATPTVYLSVYIVYNEDENNYDIILYELTRLFCTDISLFLLFSINTKVVVT